MKKIYSLIAIIMAVLLTFSASSVVFAAEDRELTNDEKAAFIVRDEWTGWVRDFTASLSELDQIATAKIYDDMDFYDMQYRFTEKYKKVPEYLDEEGKPTQKLKDMIKEKRKKISGAAKREFLCFTAKENGVTIELSNANLGNIGISSDGVSFNSWDGSAVSLDSGDKLYVWNKSNTLSNDSAHAQFSITGGNVEASGDVASMINFGDAQRHCFDRLFLNQTNLTSLPEITLTNTAYRCFYRMFSGCENAKVGPSSLQIENIAKEACFEMFYQCYRLEKAPSIYAKSVEAGSCREMFRQCTSLTTAPELPATILGDRCYKNMFDGCTSLTTAPDLPATTLAYYCYHAMFEGCTSLSTAPTSLPALIVSDSAYGYMFNNCIQLRESPMIKATTIESGGIESMFSQCEALNIIHLENYAGELNDNVSRSWVSGVAAIGTIYYPGTTTDRGRSKIPLGWTVVSSN